MPDFLIESEGKKFKVTAPDQETALAAFAEAAGLPTAGGNAQAQQPTTSATQQRYDKAIQAIIDANPGASPEDIASLKQHYGPSNVGDLAQAGTTFGLSDELAGVAGGLKAMFGGKNFGESYGRWSELEAAREALGREQSGMLGSAAELGTGLLTMGPARAGVEAIVAGAPRVARTTSLMQDGAAGLATGAALGGIGGFTSTDGSVGDRTGGAIRGTLAGATIGAVAPALATGSGSAYERVAQALADRDAARGLRVSPEAARFMQTTLGADDALGPAGAQRMAAAGHEAMLADAGPSARNALDYAIQSSGQAGREATEAISGRTARDARAITDAMDTAFGRPEGVQTTRANIRNSSAAARGRTYDTAYATPIDYSSTGGRAVEDLLGRVRPADVAAANQMMIEEGAPSRQIIARIGNDGRVTFERQPDVRQIDYITRALNDRADAADGTGKLGGTTTAGRITRGLATQLRQALRGAVPEYATALDTAADPIRRSQAVVQGSQLFSATREEVADQLAGMTTRERQAMAQGVRSQLDETLANVMRTVMDGDTPAREAIQALKTLSSRASRQKVALVIGDAEADRFFAELDRAARSFDLRAGVADNSRTFQRQEMNRRVEAQTMPNGIVGTAMRGEPVNAVKRVVQALTGMTPEAALGRKDEMMVDVVRMLTEQGPNATGNAPALAQLGRRNAAAQRVVDAIISSGRLAGPAAYLAGAHRSGQQP